MSSYQPHLGITSPPRFHSDEVLLQRTGCVLRTPRERMASVPEAGMNFAFGEGGAFIIEANNTMKSCGESTGLAAALLCLNGLIEL